MTKFRPVFYSLLLLSSVFLSNFVTATILQGISPSLGEHMRREEKKNHTTWNNFISDILVTEKNYSRRVWAASCFFAMRRMWESECLVGEKCGTTATTAWWARFQYQIRQKFCMWWVHVATNPLIIISTQFTLMWGKCVNAHGTMSIEFFFYTLGHQSRLPLWSVILTM